MNLFLLTLILPVEKLIVCENPITKEPILVYLKVQRNNWCQFFLDSGLGFWQSLDESEIETDEYNYPDRTIELELLDKKIWCETNKNNSRIILEFEDDEKLILQTTEPEIFDSESELIKLKKLH